MGLIIVGVDGSETSDAALKWAARQAKLTGDHLKVVMCWEMPVSFGTSAIEPPVDIDYAADARERLQSTVASSLGNDPDLDMTLVIVQGHPSLALTEEAEEADLLVVGSHGHGEIAGMLLGSTGMYAATHSPCPVVIVRKHQEKDKK